MDHSERRRHLRMRTYKTARILLNTHHSTITCVVRNLSESGACLDIASAMGIPTQFDLMLDGDRSVRNCRMVWHRERKIGVEFMSQPSRLEQAA